jgi:hypothetical protein
LLGFVPEVRLLCAFEPSGDGRYLALHPLLQGRLFQRCQNGREFETCNWMVPDGHEYQRCKSCRLNQVIPDLTQPRHAQLWYEVEKAKRRLLYTLFALELPLRGHHRESGGLAFKFLADDRLRHREDYGWTDQRVSTGHHNGVITINLMEADPTLREAMRESMNEAYRTLLGHFRHESGHYYWFRFFHGENGSQAALAEFRQLFGDERQDYGAALQRYYNEGPAADWTSQTISAYASSHPWEDFAETWAHYLHMTDTLETASDAGFQIGARQLASPLMLTESTLPFGPLHVQADFDHVIADWVVLTQTMNLLNRSMGLADAYPFTLTDTVMDKLRFIHRLIGQHQGESD